MEKRVIEIKENFAKYEKLLIEIKNSSSKTIILDEIKGNHNNTRIKKVDVSHSTIPDNLELIIESKIENKRDFKFS